MLLIKATIWAKHEDSSPHSKRGTVVSY